ncbi:MAG: glycoside hydrolase family 127 protein [Eubacteriales bacterium]|nr:glycoside hydrolase family 127 protein [Eubacteriales bacterium]
MDTVKLILVKSNGRTVKLAEKITQNWLIGLRETNPAILDMFAERDMQPYRDLLPWSGEFAGKYITGAYFIYRMTLNPELYQYIQDFIAELLTCQAEDGYLGCYSKKCRLTGAFSQSPENRSGTWDSWSHYHIMYGLLLWYGETRNGAYLEAVERIAGLFINTFYTDAGRRLVDIGSSEMNLAPIHSFALLYQITGKGEYLDFARHIEKDFNDPNAGNYISCALGGIEFYRCPKPRWESLHAIIGLAELYRATGEKYYRDASEFICRSILRTDIHNTGGFSTSEQAVGNPFGSGAIESCCVIAYNALAIETYKLTADVSLIDFLELSHYNACLGIWSPTGRWSVYDAPMNGSRKANFHDIGFQCRPGSPELNCCSVNAARAVGNLSEWRFTRDDDTLWLNLWESGEFVTDDGATITIEGMYPAPGRVCCEVKDYTGRLALRIPHWSAASTVTANGVKQPVPAGYRMYDCGGRASFTLDFDFGARYIKGEGEQQGYHSLYRGPILFGCDVSDAAGNDLNALPAISAKELSEARVVVKKDMYTIPLSGGIELRDFFHLGRTGSEYRSWLRVE